MMKTLAPALSIAVVLALPLPLHGEPAQSDSFEGTGEARVVGGNVVSARRQALARAQSAALLAAVSSVTDVAALPAQLRAALLARGTLITTYRVVEERRDGPIFRLRIAARVAMGALHRQLVGRGVAPRTPSGAPPSNMVALWAEPPLRDALVTGLRQRGYRVVLLPGTRADARQRARAAAEVTLVVASQWRAALGVRGLGLEGARVDLHADVHVSASWASLARLSRRGWGAGPSAEEARRQALTALLPRLVGDVAALLDKRGATLALAPGDVLVGVGGLAGFGELDAICQLLRAQQAQRCGPKRFEVGRVWLALSGTSGAARVARALTDHSFSSFNLALERVEGQRVWLRAQPRPPSASAPPP